MIAHRFVFSPIRTGRPPVALLSLQFGDWACDVALHWIGWRGDFDFSPRRRTFVLQWLVFSASLVRLPPNWRPPLMPEDGANPATIRLSGTLDDVNASLAAVVELAKEAPPGALLLSASLPDGNVMQLRRPDEYLLRRVPKLDVALMCRVEYQDARGGLAPTADGVVKTEWLLTAPNPAATMYASSDRNRSARL